MKLNYLLSVIKTAIFRNFGYMISKDSLRLKKKKLIYAKSLNQLNPSGSDSSLVTLR